MLALGWPALGPVLVFEGHRQGPPLSLEAGDPGNAVGVEEASPDVGTSG